MGQKIHPYGYRVGITQPHAVRWFANKYQYPQYVFEDFLLKQSLFKNLPVENLPRKRTEDKSETKLVQIKIERLIRNTIKVKLYVTSPENAQELFETLDFNNSKKESLKPTKATFSSNLDTKKQLNSIILNIQKKALHKKILQLQILKLQNMHSKLVMFKTLLNQSSIKSDSLRQAPLNPVITTPTTLLSNNSKTGTLKLSDELNLISSEKQKVLNLLSKFESSSTFYTTQLSKIKQLNLTGFILLNKFSYLNRPDLDKSVPEKSKLANELKTVLAKNVLRVRKLELQLDKNSKNLNTAVTTKLSQLTTLETQLTQIIKVIGALEILRTNGKIDNVTSAELVKTFVQLDSKTHNKFVGSYFTKYCFVLGKNLKLSNSNLLDILRKDYLVALTNIIKTDANSLYRAKSLYKLSVAVLNQRYNLNQLIELKIKTLMLKFTKTQDKIHLSSIQQLNTCLRKNSTFIKQLESWLTLLTKKLNHPPVTTTQLLRDRIYKIDCYVNKLSWQNESLSNQSTENLSGSFFFSETEKNCRELTERNFIFVNYNIVKQKLIAELLKMEKPQILALSFSSLKGNLSEPPSTLSPSFDAQLTKTLQVLQNRLSGLKQSYFDTSGSNPFAQQNQTEGQNTEVQSESKIIFSNSEKGETTSSLSKTLRLKTALQNLLKTNYENSFVVLQSRRQVYNNIIHRLGGKRRYNQILTKEKTWTNPFSKFQNEQKTVVHQSLVKDKVQLMELLETINQKIYQRKPIKALETRKQKFLVKKAIKKRLKQYLLLMLINTNTNLASLKTIYNVKTLSKLCENLTDLQTVPKVSVIELVKVHQPKQYAVCLANFVVENLEKRFSFRSTMKKAAEQAMSTSNVKGIKIQIAGRLNGAEIARTEWLREGVVPLQTLRANIDYSYKTAKTIYGILGVKVWLFKE